MEAAGSRVAPSTAAADSPPEPLAQPQPQPQPQPPHPKQLGPTRPKRPPPPHRPSPANARPEPHVKTHHSCHTPDGWRLHLVRTQAAPPRGPAQPQQPPRPSPPTPGAAPSNSPLKTPHTTITASSHRQPEPLLPAPPSSPSSPPPPPPPPAPRRCPVVLCPGLGSSGAYTFDLSPVVSLADYLADRGWDVWTVELRGNGQSDRPRLFVRSRWWSIDDYVTKDVPTVLSYVRRHTGAPQVHLLGHSMGGMIATRVLALGGEAAAGVRSAIVVGSGCFLQGSRWQKLQGTIGLARLLWSVPAGAILRAYSPLALGRWTGWRRLDQLYFWPPNTDPTLARAVLARNFSSISPGVILQFRSAFGPCGLCTADGAEAFADPARLAAVRQPVLFICGDRDRMCPAEGAAATASLFTGSACARFVALGPAHGQRTHYGHFDILMGRAVEAEVFPTLHDWLAQHDGPGGGEAGHGGQGMLQKHGGAAGGEGGLQQPQELQDLRGHHGVGGPGGGSGDDGGGGFGPAMVAAEVPESGAAGAAAGSLERQACSAVVSYAQAPAVAVGGHAWPVAGGRWQGLGVGGVGGQLVLRSRL